MSQNNLLSRQIALNFLKRLDEPDVNTHLLFDGLMERTDISVQDKAFTRALVLSVLRHRGQIDFALAQLLEKPLSAKLKDIQNILRLGVAQVLYLNVPVHAALDTAVELSKKVRQGAFSKLVNGVLRALLRQQEKFENISPRYNWPMWLYHLLEKAYGPDKMKRFSDCFLMQQAVDLTVRDNPQKWAIQLGGQVLKTGSVRLKESGKISALDGFKEGEWWVQNAAASVPVQLFSDLRGKHVADLCAAPGGKTAQLALAGAKVDAFDASEFRLNRLRENMSRLGFQVKTRVADVLSLENEPLYDAVLLDAPCSATGTIGRHPEILMHLKKEDIARLVRVQKQLLNQAILMTKSGGQIVFSTCSLLPDEGEKIMAWALKKYPFLKRGQIPDYLADFKNQQGDIRITPDQEMDGFFAGILIKEI